MNCREVRRWMSPYLDSELGATKTFEVSEHLRECSPCRSRFESERQVDEWVARSLSGPGMPEEDVQAIEQIIRSSSGRRRTWRLWSLAAGSLAAACIALAVAYFDVGAGSSGNDYAGAWAVQRLTDVAGTSESFAQDGIDAGELGRISAEVLASSLSIREGAVEGHHDMKIVKVNRRVDDGAGWLEVQVSCCGQPVLLAIARQDHPGRLTKVAERVSRQSNYKHTDGAMNLLARQTGDLVILAVSKHPVEQVVDAVEVTAA